jgi:hypothetical protein
LLLGGIAVTGSLPFGAFVADKYMQLKIERLSTSKDGKTERQRSRAVWLKGSDLV